HRLAGGGELSKCAQWCRLGHLTAGVRVDLGVEHQNVDVAAGGQHVVEPAGADVVRPTVAPDDPYAASDQGVHHAEQGTGRGSIESVETVPEFGHPLALSVQLRLPQLRGRQNGVDELGTE